MNRENLNQKVVNEEEAVAIRTIFDKYVNTDLGANGIADCALSQKNIADKMKAIRAKLKDAEILDQFDRVVFQSFEE